MMFRRLFGTDVDLRTQSTNKFIAELINESAVNSRAQQSYWTHLAHWRRWLCALTDVIYIIRQFDERFINHSMDDEITQTAPVSITNRTQFMCNLNSIRIVMFQTAFYLYRTLSLPNDSDYSFAL